MWIEESNNCHRWAKPRFQFWPDFRSQKIQSDGWLNCSRVCSPVACLSVVLSNLVKIWFEKRIRSKQFVSQRLWSVRWRPIIVRRMLPRHDAAPPLFLPFHFSFMLQRLIMLVMHVHSAYYSLLDRPCAHGDKLLLRISNRCYVSVQYLAYYITITMIFFFSFWII